MDHAIESFIPVVAIVFTFGIPGIIIFWWLYTKHRERMRLIEKGRTKGNAGTAKLTARTLLWSLSDNKAIPSGRWLSWF